MGTQSIRKTTKSNSQSENHILIRDEFTASFNPYFFVACTGLDNSTAEYNEFHSLYVV